MPEYVYDTEGLLKKYSVADMAKMLTNSAVVTDADLDKFAETLQTPKFSREKTGIIGCGAYALGDWTAGESLVLTKKANWWGDKLAAQVPTLTAYPEQLIYKPVKDASAAVSLVKNGEIDAMTIIPPKDFAEMKKDDKMTAQYNFVTVPILSNVIVGLNCKSPKLTDKRVRRALAHLFDVTTIIKTVGGGYGTPCPSPILPQRTYFDKELTIIPLDTAKARALLAEAGWKDTNKDGTVDKNKIEMRLRYVFASANESAKNMGLMVQELGKKIGVSVELMPLETKIMFDNLKKRDFDMFVNSSTFLPTLDDPSELWSSKSNTPDGGNRCQFEINKPMR
ncbi:MAG: hypothetical protein HC817_08450 [Saprospiraceae bacterium]|nr:hypothetical protein [Saprospiraceae bacterium]